MIDLSQLCERIRQRDEEAARELIELLRFRLRPILSKYRAYGYDVFQEVCLQTIQDIREDRIEHPESIVFYALRIAVGNGAKFVMREKRVMSIIEGRHKHTGPSPLDEVLAAEQAWRLKEWIDRLAPQRKEVVERFYFECQPKEMIQRDMGLTDTQFRLLKSRALNDLRSFRRMAETPKPGIVRKPDILAAA